jgi:hypothetical protein
MGGKISSCNGHDAEIYKKKYIQVFDPTVILLYYMIQGFDFLPRNKPTLE